MAFQGGHGRVANYYNMLACTVADLESNASETRRAVYKRARETFVNQFDGDLVSQT
jgi:hypothetical protein